MHLILAGHAIVPIKQERLIQRKLTEAIQPRVSLVFRNIATTITQPDSDEPQNKTE